jgi:hypothetical protein
MKSAASAVCRLCSRVQQRAGTSSRTKGTFRHPGSCHASCRQGHFRLQGLGAGWQVGTSDYMTGTRRLRSPRQQEHQVVLTCRYCDRQ